MRRVLISVALATSAFVGPDFFSAVAMASDRPTPTTCTLHSGEITKSPQVVNALGDIGSGEKLPICVVWTSPTTGKHTVSPPIMTYDDLSDTQPAYISIGATLWVYDVATTKGSQLLRISNTTEKVLQTIKVPTGIARPIVAADAFGFWFAESFYGGPTIGAPGVNPILYHVAIGAKEPVALLRVSGNATVSRLCYAGQRVWVQLGVNGDGEGQTYAGYLINKPGTKPVREERSPFTSCSSYGDYQD